MKINEIVIEAVNPSTGTPNADPERGWDQDTYTGHVDPNTVQMPDFSGLTQAAQGAKTLGQGFKKGWQGVKKLAGGVRGAVQGFQGTSAQHTGQKETEEAAKHWATKWNEAVGADPTIAQNPTALQNFAKKITSNRINPAAPTDMSAPGVVKYLTTALGQYKATIAIGGQPPPPPNDNAEPEQAAAAPSRFVDADGNPMAAAPAQPTKPTAHDPQQPTHDLVKGAQIIQQDPIIIKHKNKEYGLNDNGQWVHFGSTKVPHQSFQAFLDNQAGFAPQQMEESVDIGQVLWDKMKRKQ